MGRRSCRPAKTPLKRSLATTVFLGWRSPCNNRPSSTETTQELMDSVTQCPVSQNVPVKDYPRSQNDLGSRWAHTPWLCNRPNSSLGDSLSLLGTLHQAWRSCHTKVRVRLQTGVSCRMFPAHPCFAGLGYQEAFAKACFPRSAPHFGLRSLS